jgi:endonuclease/exonuclease/phosphatase family metal-dependent hydrolase
MLSRWTSVVAALALALLSSPPAVVAAQAPAQDGETRSSSHVAPTLLHSHTRLHGRALAMQHPLIQTQGETAAPARASRRPRLRVGSLNIRYDVHSRHPLLKPATDLLRLHRTWGEQRWDRRRDQLVDQVLFHELDVVGFQEVLHHQLGDLAQLLGGEDQEEGWGHVGVGRDDGKHAGEAVPIFYRKSVPPSSRLSGNGQSPRLIHQKLARHRSRLELISVSHRWLSPTPSEPGSKGWDAGQPRMITFAHFRDLDLAPEEEEDETPSRRSATRTDLIVANTHWDDRGLLAREKSAELILGLVREQVDDALARRQQGGVPSSEQQSADARQEEPLVVLLGDLNSPAEEAGYQVLTGRRYLDAAVADPGAEVPTGSASTTTATNSQPRSFFDARHELVVRRRSSHSRAAAAPESRSHLADSTTHAPAGGTMARCVQLRFPSALPPSLFPSRV